MPMVRLSSDTVTLLRQQATTSFRFVNTAKRRDDGDWDVPIVDEVAYRIATERLPGESDDNYVSRLVRAAIGRRPD